MPGVESRFGFLCLRVFFVGDGESVSSIAPVVTIGKEICCSFGLSGPSGITAAMALRPPFYCENVYDLEFALMPRAPKQTVYECRGAVYRMVAFQLITDEIHR